MAAKEPRNKAWGGFTIRPRRSASFREMVKHGDRHLGDRRSAADTVSRRSSVRVVGGFASRKWFVSLTGEIPTRPLPTGGGKPTYKSRTKAEATREERNRGCKEVSIQPEDVLR
ncbi:MAG: hypothetical protein COA72_10580 [Candidatus Neomarinimicrobiota bacterium]|nr:MAG: hypothetical protein COA72_10580 [Candidatus Neomarinimicrobiota bacterium]